MKRILFAADDKPGQVDGPSSWLCRLVPLLEGAGVQVRVCLFCRDEPANCALYSALSDLGVDLSAHHGGFIRDGVEWLLGEIDRFAPEVFVPNHSVKALYASWCLGKGGPARWMMFHSDDANYYKRLQIFVNHPDGPAVDGVVAVSEYLQQKLEGLVGGKVKVARIPYGAPDVERRAHWSVHPFKLVYVGRFVEYQKRISKVFEAFESACRALPNVEGYFVGSGEEEGVIAEGVKDSPVGDRLHLVGRLPSHEVQKFMAECQAVVLLSDFEGIPITMLEAMAVGTVMISSRMKSGIPELISEGETGCFVDEETFVSTVESLVKDQAYWEQLSHQARERFLACFSQQNVINLWRELIESGGPVDGQPAPQIRFPSVPLKCSWVDESMATGFLSRMELKGRRYFWEYWNQIPYSKRKAYKKMFSLR